jgi:hypothetical protein
MFKQKSQRIAILLSHNNNNHNHHNNHIDEDSNDGQIPINAITSQPSSFGNIILPKKINNELVEDNIFKKKDKKEEITPSEVKLSDAT